LAPERGYLADRSRPARQARPSARGVAIRALLAAEDGARANIELPRLLAASGLSQRDRAFATELTYGTLRMLRACDWLIGQFHTGELEPVVLATARTGAYQLAYMRVPAYAAVSATVAESPPRAKPLLNAVLRRIGALVEAGPLRWPDAGTRLSYPNWVVARLVGDLGEAQAFAALEQMNEPASVHMRPDGYVQDLASQWVGEHMGELLSDAPAGPVLDLCAAPGGKATQLARCGRFVVAADVAASRAQMIAANVSRLGLGDVSVLVADGTVPSLRPASFAGVLVDAPCSGLGVLRRRPDARWRARPEDVPRLAQLQRRLLAAAASLVCPGGVLVYSVCTLTWEETTGIDEWLVGKAGATTTSPPGGAWQAVRAPGPPWEPFGRGARLLPQAAGTDGMYVLALGRTEEHGARS